jgi:hypothetical protein
LFGVAGACFHGNELYPAVSNRRRRLVSHNGKRVPSEKKKKLQSPTKGCCCSVVTSLGWCVVVSWWRSGPHPWRYKTQDFGVFRSGNSVSSVSVVYCRPVTAVYAIDPYSILFLWPVPFLAQFFFFCGGGDPFDGCSQHSYPSLSTQGPSISKAAIANGAFFVARDSICEVGMWKHFFPEFVTILGELESLAH